MIEVTCKNCGVKAEVTGLLAAAQQPCPACGKPLLGEQTAGSFKAPAPGYHEDLPRPDAGKPRAKLSFTGAIVGALLGPIVVLALALVGEGLDAKVRGAVFGALAGVLLTPFIALGMFFAALRSKTFMFVSVGDMASESMMDALAGAINERRFGKALVFLVMLVLVGMAIGGLLGSNARRINPLLVALGCLGAACLFGGIGFAAAPTAAPDNDEEAKPAEQPKQET